MSRPALSVVVPLFNEAAVVQDLVRRCLIAGRQTNRTFELILVDDASTDGTAALAPSLAVAPVRYIRLPRNAGQFGATQAGLAASSGDLVCVLDGDLQDPPELIPELVAACLAGEDAVAFAVKRRRTDPIWFRLGAFAYRLLQMIPPAVRIPAGAGSFCVMRASLARKVALLPVQTANLSAVLVALGATPQTVSYEKAARADGRSRVGLVGLAREATGSLLITGALARLMVEAGLGVIGVAMVFVARGDRTADAEAVSGAVAIALAAVLDGVRRRRLTPGAPSLASQRHG